MTATDTDALTEKDMRALHRRLEARADIRGRAVHIYQQRASEAEAAARRARDRAYKADLAWEDEKRRADKAEARIGRLENRAASETIRANTWRDKHRVMAGKRDAAHRAYQAEREARREAEARVKAVEDVLDNPIRLTDWDDPLVPAGHVRRALESVTPPRSE